MNKLKLLLLLSILINIYLYTKNEDLYKDINELKITKKHLLENIIISNDTSKELLLLSKKYIHYYETVSLLVMQSDKKDIYINKINKGYKLPKISIYESLKISLYYEDKLEKEFPLKK